MPEDSQYLNTAMSGGMKWTAVVRLLLGATLGLPALCIAQEREAGASQFPVLTGEYLGQEQPGLNPAVFAPGLVSRPLGFAIPPDGRMIVFASWGGEPRARIMFLELENDHWAPPRVMPFSGEYMDWDVNFSPDGQLLYFSSRRPRPGTSEPIEDADIWFVRKTDNGWGEPQHLGSPVSSALDEVHPTVAGNGNIYFFGRRDGGPGGADVSVARFVDGEYLAPELLGSEINTEHAEMDPFISPDESFLIFHSDRPGGPGRMNLYISFRDEEGNWTQAVSMGESVNPEGATTYCGRVSHDGRFLFFHRIEGDERNAYWVSAEVIEQLRMPGS